MLPCLARSVPRFFISNPLWTLIHPNSIVR
jgi:hypothetical protein